VRLVFQGRELEVGPAPLSDGRVFAEGHNRPDTVALVLGAMERGAELVLQNVRLTQAERAAQAQSIAAVPPRASRPWCSSPREPPAYPKRHGWPRQPGSERARGNEVLQVGGRSRFLCVLPLFHVGGLGILFRCRLAGATMLLHERFDADAVARDLRDGATHASLVASALARVLEQGAAFPPVIVAVGGGPVPRPLLDRARRAGLRVLQTWA